jgi:hypothetical protein
LIVDPKYRSIGIHANQRDLPFSIPVFCIPAVQ